MKQAEQDLLKIIKSALFQGALEPLEEDTDFAALFAEAKVQCVYPIAYDCLGKAGIEIQPAQVKEQWSQSVYRQLYRNNRLQIAQREVVTLLEQAGIPCVILKGTSAAACYPEPSLRVLGDIDILVKPEQQMDAVKCLQEIGYGDVMDEDHHCHYTIRKNGLCVEIHREPNGLFICGDEKVCGNLRAFFADAVGMRQWDGEFPVLSDHHQAVVLLLHKLEHFMGSGLGLRQLCDWAVFVDKRMTDDLWKELKPQLESFGLGVFTQMVTRVCVDYLGLPMNRAPWAKSADTELARLFIEEIICDGNFGRKESAQNYGNALFLDLKENSAAGSFIRALIDACKRHWPPCQKHPVLVPLALPKVLLRHIRLRRSGQRAAFKPMVTMKNAKARRELVDSLKPFRVAEK